MSAAALDLPEICAGLIVDFRSHRTVSGAGPTTQIPLG